MTGQMGDSARRLLAAFFALALLVASRPGTNWTAVPADPDLSPGDYALVQVAHGTAGAVAAKATAAGATDVAALDKLDLVTARLSADALRSLQSDSRVSSLAADAVVEASGRENNFEQGKARPSPGVQVVDADQAWSGATGRGVTVALMDTGIAQHPDLEGSVISRLDFVNDAATLELPPRAPRRRRRVRVVRGRHGGRRRRQRWARPGDGRDAGRGSVRHHRGLVRRPGNPRDERRPRVDLLEPRSNTRRFREAGRSRAGRAHRVAAGPRNGTGSRGRGHRPSRTVRALDGNLRVDGHGRRRRGGRPRGAPRLQPDAGQRRAHREWATDRRHPNPRPRRRRRADRSAGACQRGSSAVAGAAPTSGGERECVRSWPYVGGDLLGGHL